MSVLYDMNSKKSYFAVLCDTQLQYPILLLAICIVRVRSNMLTYEHLHNIQEPLDGYFPTVENQGKWVKNQEKSGK